MSKAIVTLEDQDDGTVKIDINFGEEGGSPISGAHNMAVTMVNMTAQMMGQMVNEQGEISNGK
jgi:hypothetical protein